MTDHAPADGTLAEWLSWQEALNPVEIDLGLERIRAVADRLSLQQPDGGVFLVAGTNGKGSVVSALMSLLQASGYRAGSYTSPHLINYNERVMLGITPATDGQLIHAFEQVEAARGDADLTYFEFGTLAAFVVLSEAQLDAWVVEVGLGGRLDATNILDPDVSLITTIALDHQEYLGDTIDAIAREKAGIMRAGKPVLFGDPAMPPAIGDVAAASGAALLRAGSDFEALIDAGSWCFRMNDAQLDGLHLPPGEPQVQCRNRALALAAFMRFAPDWRRHAGSVDAALDVLPPGRFQIVDDGGRNLQWVLDVGHNVQALDALAANLQALDKRPQTLVFGMLGDKDVDAAGALLSPLVQRCIVTDVGGARGQTAAALAGRLEASGMRAVEAVAAIDDALARAVELTPAGGRIVVSGSFFVVGPALEWLTIGT